MPDKANQFLCHYGQIGCVPLVEIGEDVGLGIAP